MDPDADLQGSAKLRIGDRFILGGCLLHIERRPHGEFGVVFVRNRRAKHHHQAIAGELVHRAIVSVNARDQAPQ